MDLHLSWWMLHISVKIVAIREGNIFLALTSWPLPCHLLVPLLIHGQRRQHPTPSPKCRISNRRFDLICGTPCGHACSLKTCESLLYHHLLIDFFVRKNLTLPDRVVRFLGIEQAARTCIKINQTSFTVLGDFARALVQTSRLMRSNIKEDAIETLKIVTAKADVCEFDIISKLINTYESTHLPVVHRQKIRTLETRAQNKSLRRKLLRLRWMALPNKGCNPMWLCLVKRLCSTTNSLMLMSTFGNYAFYCQIEIHKRGKLSRSGDHDDMH